MEYGLGNREHYSQAANYRIPNKVDLKEKIKDCYKNKVTQIGSFLKYPGLFKISEQDSRFFTDKKFNRDMGYLRKKKKLIEESPLSQSELETLQLSKALEAYLVDKLPSILSEETVAHPALDYVDQAQGSDVILESPELGDYLSIDVTLGAGSSYKLEETAQTYYKGETYKADYFVGKGNNLTHIESMPHVVLGLDRAHFEKEIPQWLEGADPDPKLSKIVLEQGLTQLRVYAKYFETKNLPDISARFSAFAKLFEKSLESLNQTHKDALSADDYDQVQEMIENSLLENYNSSVTDAAHPKKESSTPKTGRVIKIPRK